MLGQVAGQAQEAVALVAEVEQARHLDRLALEGLVDVGALALAALHPLAVVAVAAPATTTAVARLAFGRGLVG